MRSVPTPSLDGADNATSSGAADGATTHAKQAIQKFSFHFGNTQPLVRMRVARDVAEAEQIAVKRNLLYYVLNKKMIYILDALAFDSVEILGPKTITILIMIMLWGLRQIYAVWAMLQRGMFSRAAFIFHSVFIYLDSLPLFG